MTQHIKNVIGSSFRAVIMRAWPSLGCQRSPLTSFHAANIASSISRSGVDIIPDACFNLMSLLFWFVGLKTH